MIAFDFDRAKMRARLMIHSTVALGAVVLGMGLFHIAGRGWAAWAVITLVYAFLPQFFECMRFLGVLVRGLKRDGKAVRVNQDGLVDNASEYALGQLRWDEIERMYPSDSTTRLLVNWWDRMPVISKQRGIVVVLRDGVNLQRVLPSKSGLVRLLMRPWYVAGRGRWLFIPEMVLTVTADELMRQLNLFYVTEVKGAA